MSDIFSSAAPTVAIHLLDPTCERTVKTWRFTAKEVITIGRADDRDVEIPDAYVSRLHAELQFQNGKWLLLSKGRNGVLVNNDLVDNFQVPGNINFRLGQHGPALRFEMTTTPEIAESSRTLCFDTLPTDFFGVDRRKVQREVEEITDGNYFRELQEKAMLLRKQRE